MTKQDSLNAKRILAERGWVLICSIMHDGGSKDYGLMYRRLETDETFYLNKETYRELPQ